jgi:hypothetical protein
LNECLGGCIISDKLMLQLILHRYLSFCSFVLSLCYMCIKTWVMSSDFRFVYFSLHVCMCVENTAHSARIHQRNRKSRGRTVHYIFFLWFLCPFFSLHISSCVFYLFQYSRHLLLPTKCNSFPRRVNNNKKRASFCSEPHESVWNKLGPSQQSAINTEAENVVLLLLLYFRFCVNSFLFVIHELTLAFYFTLLWGGITIMLDFATYEVFVAALPKIGVFLGGGGAEDITPYLLLNLPTFARRFDTA